MNKYNLIVSGDVVASGVTMGEALEIKRDNPGMRFELADYITIEQARNFWKDVMGTIYGDPNRTYNTGTASTRFIADKMGMSYATISDYLYRCADKDVRLTERQGGCWVI